MGMLYYVEKEMKRKLLGYGRDPLKEKQESLEPSTGNSITSTNHFSSLHVLVGLSSSQNVRLPVCKSRLFEMYVHTEDACAVDYPVPLSCR